MQDEQTALADYAHTLDYKKVAVFYLDSKSPDSKLIDEARAAYSEGAKRLFSQLFSRRHSRR